MGALRTGTLDFGCLGQGALLSVVPEVAAIGLPFLFANLPDAWAALDGPVGQRLGKALESKNLVFLAWRCNGIRQTTNNKRPITKPDDLKGLKIRTPLDAATVDMFAAMGATPQQISWGEVYLALQSGVVDGQENPLANIYAGKLYEVQKFVSFTNHKYEATGLVVSTATWGRLSEADRKLVKEAAAEVRSLPAQADGGIGRKAGRRVQEDGVAADEQRRHRALPPGHRGRLGPVGKEALRRFRQGASRHCASRSRQTSAGGIASRPPAALVRDDRDRGSRMAWRPRALSIAQAVDRTVELGCNVAVADRRPRPVDPAHASWSCCATSSRRA